MVDVLFKTVRHSGGTAAIVTDAFPRARMVWQKPTSLCRATGKKRFSLRRRRAQ